MSGQRTQGGHDVLESLDVRRFLDQMPDFVSVLSPELTVIYLNRVSTRMDSADSYGMPLSSMLRDESVRAMEEAVGRIQRTHEPETVLVRTLFSEDTFENTVAPLLDRHGRLVAYVLTSRRITGMLDEQERLARLLEREREVTAELRHLDQLRAEFVARIAHDLRTPITTVQGFAHTLQDRWAQLDDDQRDHFLQLVIGGADQLARLVEDTLEVVRIESPEFRIRVEPFPVAVFGELCEQMSVGKDEGRIRFHSDDDSLRVRADQARCRQVLGNLVGNALKFSPAGSPVEVNVSGAGRDVVIRVTDHGIGIAPADQPKLFQKFVQLGDQRGQPRSVVAGGSAGTGLGLYICRRLVDAQHGSIEVDSTPGSGTTMTVRLPAERS